jgi:CRISPR/Cas system-associated protein Cas5 (RAMP superfamily)
MKKENFEGLKESIIEAGKILRGEAQPSREFVHEAPDSFPPPVKVLAVCVETDDEALLVPRKIYEIEVTDEFARVIDEAGEAAVYPTRFFIPINLPAEVRQIIAQLS